MTDQEVESFYNRLQPTAWSVAARMSPRERAQCFFLYHSDDLELITAAHAAIANYLFAHKSLAESRADWQKSLEPIPLYDLWEAYDITAGFYWELCNAARERPVISKQLSDVLWPNFEQIGRSSCGFKKIQIVCPQCHEKYETKEPGNATHFECGKCGTKFVASTLGETSSPIVEHPKNKISVTEIFVTLIVTALIGILVLAICLATKGSHDPLRDSAWKAVQVHTLERLARPEKTSFPSVPEKFEILPNGNIWITGECRTVNKMGEEKAPYIEAELRKDDGGPYTAWNSSHKIYVEPEYDTWIIHRYSLGGQVLVNVANATAEELKEWKD